MRCRLLPSFLSQSFASRQRRTNRLLTSRGARPSRARAINRLLFWTYTIVPRVTEPTDVSGNPHTSLRYTVRTFLSRFAYVPPVRSSVG